MHKRVPYDFGKRWRRKRIASYAAHKVVYAASAQALYGMLKHLSYIQPARFGEVVYQSKMFEPKGDRYKSFDFKKQTFFYFTPAKSREISAIYHASALWKADC